jgi:hypothetical protein
LVTCQANILEQDMARGEQDTLRFRDKSNARGRAQIGFLPSLMVGEEEDMICSLQEPAKVMQYRLNWQGIVSFGQITKVEPGQRSRVPMPSLS